MKPPAPQEAAAIILDRSPRRPRIAILLGSGFGGAAGQVQVETEIPYERIPGFGRTSVRGHAGKLIVGMADDVPILLLGGRAHYYEGRGFAEVTFPMRVLAALEIDVVLLTNAAGAIQRRFERGDFMVVRDHINLMGDNPLRGAPLAGESQFVDLSRLYDADLQQLLVQAGRRVQARVHRGVYLAVSGPSYETPAEIRAFARLGADAVGMSTVPEAMVACQCGLRVAALSCITNLAAGRSPAPISHAEVLEVAQRIEHQTGRLLLEFVRGFAAASRKKKATESI